MPWLSNSLQTLCKMVMSIDAIKMSWLTSGSSQKPQHWDSGVSGLCKLSALLKNFDSFSAEIYLQCEENVHFQMDEEMNLWLHVFHLIPWFEVQKCKWLK